MNAMPQRKADRAIPSIAGGVMSLNRLMDPMIEFVRAKGAYLWDSNGKKYIDYHAAFAPYLLGHGEEKVDSAVVDSIRRGESLFGAGATPWEQEVADLLVDSVPGLEQVQLTGSGTEAVGYAVRLARAATGRHKVLVMQGGYNGWMDALAFNLMDPAAAVKDHRYGEEHKLRPITAGLSEAATDSVHVVEFNDLDAIETVLKKEEIACVVLEPILQNVGIVKPKAGYLEGIRRLCDQHGVVLVFDEVKTGFRHALGGYQSICGIVPDLSVFGKAVANGYPVGVIGGKEEFMRYCCHPDLSKRVLIAGTYNAHPFVVAAVNATLKILKSKEANVYARLESMGQQLEQGLNDLLKNRDYPTTIVRQGSAFSVYFMDHAPESWKDIALNNDADLDVRYRKMLIEAGVFHFPVTTKQGSISAAHTESDIEVTLEITEQVLDSLR